MCGITAKVGGGDALQDVLTSLENLEYRGYDSAGVAIKNGHGLDLYKQGGEISQLKDRMLEEQPTGDIGIGHTRWSTHGPPTRSNAHPHTDCDGRLAVVHNGIIENYTDLKERLQAAGHRFESETDTEVVPHLVETYRAEGHSLEAAFRRAVDDLEGSYALVMVADNDDAVYATRNGSPLVLGLGEDTYYLASDVPAFLEFTDTVLYLEDGEFVVATPDGYRLTDATGSPVERAPETVDWDPGDAEKGGYDHYMHKEIHEQPEALRRAVEGRIDHDDGEVVLEDFPPGAFADVDDIQFVACGTSYHAAGYATTLLSQREVRAQAFRAGEYATDPAPVDADTLVIGVTQSGETADTLEALRRAADRGARTLAVTNVVGSTAVRQCDDALFIRAGPEIGVAATKTFSSQVATLTLLVERMADDLTDDGVPPERGDLLRSLADLPGDLETVLERTRAEELASAVADRESFFFIGRGVAHPVACEGALKFKEITYEHAEGFAAGQLKHGPLALVTPETPVFAVFSGRNDEKTLNNVTEVQSRGAPVIGVASDANDAVADQADEVLRIPETHPFVAGILANVTLQLVSYHVADLIGRDIDKPRNLAKCVTVE